MDLKDIKELYKSLLDILGVSLPNWLIVSIIIINLIGIVFFLIFKFYNSIPPSLSAYIKNINEKRKSNIQIKAILKNLTPNQISGINELLKNGEMIVIKNKDNSYNRQWVPFFIDNNLINHNDENSIGTSVNVRISLKFDILNIVNKYNIVKIEMED